MDEKQLAQIFYKDAIRIADKHEAPRSAIAAAMIRGGMQLFVEAEGADVVAKWLAKEAEAMRRALN